MNVVGVRFKNGEMFVPEVMVAAKAMSQGIEMVKPLIAGTDMPSEGKVLLGTVKVTCMISVKTWWELCWKAAALQLSTSVLIDHQKTLLKLLKNISQTLWACQALLTTTMLHMKDTIELMKEEGLGHIKLLLVAHPISQDFADEVGADGYAPDAGFSSESMQIVVRQIILQERYLELTIRST